MSRLAGKNCVVTAAAQGIGNAIVASYLRDGAIVLAADADAEKLSSIAPHPRLTLEQLDVTDDQAIRSLAAKNQQIDVLVNAVGYVASGSALDGGVAALDKSYAINVRSAAVMIEAFLPAMIATGKGSIINIASVVSTIKAAPNRFAYMTTKAAVLALTKSVARDYITTGVRCNSISPGTVDTPSLHERLSSTNNYDAALKDFVARQPMGRLGRAEEIAAIAVLLASDEASFMTGENIVIDGGMSL